MSTRTRATAQPTCSYCTEPRDPRSSVKGSYCSLDCWHREKGENALSKIRDRHEWCGTCYTRLKDIERPSDLYIERNCKIDPDLVIGYEYPTPALKRSGGLLYCECGTVEHYADHGFVKRWSLQDTAMRLLNRLGQLYEEDRIANDPQGAVLMRELRETELDWPLSVGRAIYPDQ